MASKAQTPAPIDRPLSRAYLRQFTGWSSAYPPGISDPTSLRVMENVMVERDGACSIRPGLRYLSYAEEPTDVTPGVPFDLELVGTHEPFFLTDGSKAYMLAVRELDGTVTFRVLGNTGLGMVIHDLDDIGIDFAVDGDLSFTAATTYVKYLQIDNKMFALSNAGEAMRYFTVGTTKTAKVLASVSRPAWTVDDKLTVLEPEAAWITSSAATTFRYNLAKNPGFENGMSHWLNDTLDSPLFFSSSSTEQARSGAKSLKLSSKPQRKNLIHNAAHNTGVYGVNGWLEGTNVNGRTAISGGVRADFPFESGGAGRRCFLDSEKFDADPGKDYTVAWNLLAVNDVETGSSATGVMVRFYNTSGARIGSDRVYTFGDNINRRHTEAIPSPAGTDKMTVHMWADAAASASGFFTIKDVMVCEDWEDTTIFDGDSGTDYFWTGTVGRSASVYHPPQTCSATISTPVDPGAVTASGYFRSNGTARSCSIDMDLDGGSGSTPVSDTGSATSDASGSWTRVANTATGGPGITHALIFFKVAAVPRGEAHYLDDVLIEMAGSAGTYFSGNTTDTPTAIHSWQGAEHDSISVEETYTVAGSVPTSETKTADTLISSSHDDNIYNFGFFYTFSTEIGESAASQVTVVRAQRGWAMWLWETPNGVGEPSGTATGNGDECADQLVAIMPEAVYDQATAEGALTWNLYMFTWSNQDAVPVTAVRVDSRELDLSKPYDSNSWIRATPMMSNAGETIAVLPTRSNRKNYTDPSHGGNGLVAADRMVVVYDPTNPAVIRWTGHEQGAYTDFTASRGGGYKTLTSGNLFIPAAVKLWQNPQSVDTLTILCLGVDGYSTGYYMAPAQVASQSAAVNIMGFEETTATPGTVSPYGVEVMNNSLYHPLDEQLMKSTASNYNINHTSVTDQIQNMWRGLSKKEWIVSSLCDNRIYYLVYNPSGAELEASCRGNEVWVFDGQAKAGTWSRWLVQGVSLRKIQQAGHVGMSLVRPDGLYFFDDAYPRDDVVVAGELSSRAIPWYLETNTQGANRAHDAWAHLQQCNITVGNFQGVMRYGVKGLDVHGKWRDTSKLTFDGNPPSTPERFDLDDYLLIRRDLKEWIFYAGSTVDETGTVQFSQGQIDLVQYRYTPVSVNVGYEFGSIETFEYGRAALPADSRTSDNGVPMPYVDTRRP